MEIMDNIQALLDFQIEKESSLKYCIQETILNDNHIANMIFENDRLYTMF